MTNFCRIAAVFTTKQLPHVDFSVVQLRRRGKMRLGDQYAISVEEELFRSRLLRNW